MSGYEQPGIDRHVQEELGDKLRQRFDSDKRGDDGLPPKLAQLMEALGGVEHGPAEGRR
jgi:hypothetical protein